MAACCCSLAGTAACRTCSYNPNAETPPPVKSYATTVTDRVLATGWKTNADRIRAMSDEELAFYLTYHPKWSDEASLLRWLREGVDE